MSALPKPWCSATSPMLTKGRLQPMRKHDPTLRCVTRHGGIHNLPSLLLLRWTDRDTLAREICLTADPAVSNCNPANANASCTTTGNAPFGGDFGPPLGPSCQMRRRDPGCLALGYPPG